MRFEDFVWFKNKLKFEISKRYKSRHVKNKTTEWYDF